MAERHSPNADKSRPGHMIISLLEMRSVGRRRLEGGSMDSAGDLNFPVLQECLKCEGFVTGMSGWPFHTYDFLRYFVISLLAA